MNLGALEITPEEAEAKVREYDEVLKAERTEQDEALAQAYRAAKRGLPLIRLSEAIRLGGWFDDGLPRIAVVRADAMECRVSELRTGPDGHTSMLFDDCWNRWPDSRGALVGSHTVRVRVDSARPSVSRYSGTTTVPLVPPRHRPKRPRRLSRCHLLWEVEEWRRTPPVDPALIRHIRGDLWAVLATWDLTELERAVLGAS